MVFGSDWRGGDPLTPKEREGRAYTVEELRMRAPIVLVTDSRFEAVNDAATCEACRGRHGVPYLHPEMPIDHPGCTNPDGCRCVIAMTTKPSGPPVGYFMDGVPAPKT